MSTKNEPEFLAIARIRKVQGRRGEVAAEILTDFPERFQAGQEMLVSGDPTPQKLHLESAWFHKGRAILKFRGFENISAAETLIGRQIQIPVSERKPLPPGELYLSDLVGCSLVEDGGILGTVDSVEETGAAPLLRVLTSQGELLVPFVAEICNTVDVAKKEIHARLPEGLKELNRSALPREPRVSSRDAGQSGTGKGQ